LTRFLFFSFFQGGGSSLKHLRRGLYLEHEEKGHRRLQGLDHVGQVLQLLVYEALTSCVDVAVACGSEL
jgi:hypothetical protein